MSRTVVPTTPSRFGVPFALVAVSSFQSPQVRRRPANTSRRRYIVGVVATPDNDRLGRAGVQFVPVRVERTPLLYRPTRGRPLVAHTFVRQGSDTTLSVFTAPVKDEVAHATVLSFLLASTSLRLSVPW